MISNLLFPPTCVLCNTTSNSELDLCTSCEHDLPFLKKPDKQITCSTRLIALFYYQTPVDQLIIGLKFNNQLINAKILGKLLAEYLCEYYQEHEKPKVIIPVPLHPTRLCERGYNQALEIARPITKKLRIPIDKSSVTRIKDTLAQTLLPAKQRKQNIERAFSITKNINYKHIAIIDDVITTGNTVTELCKALYQSGVNKIDIWCCAKAPF